MNEPKKKSKGKGYAIAAAIFFALAAWFAFLVFYIQTSTANYKPAPNEVQEGDMVMAFLVILMSGATLVCLMASLLSLLIYLFKRRRNKKDSTV